MRASSIAACGTTVLALLAPVYADASFKPPNKGGADLTIAAKPNPITFGQGTTLSGKLKNGAGTLIQLQSDVAPLDGSFLAVKQLTAGSGGSYAFAGVRPDRLTNYRVVAATSPSKTSSTITVRVAISVRLHVSDATVRRGTRVTFSGTAKPGHPGNLVQIQRRVASGSYKTVGRTVLEDHGSARSTFKKRIRVMVSGTYRARVSGDADHLSGTKSTHLEVSG
jgi:hypothetical protein